MLKNSIYKSVVGSQTTSSENNCFKDLDDMNTFFNNEKKENLKWNKINNADKLKKLIIYADIYASENNLSEEETQQLKTSFELFLSQGKLVKIKDVIYDHNLGVITSIPVLVRTQGKYTLKNIDKKSHTITLKRATVQTHSI
jgi:hypothetical protein